MTTVSQPAAILLRRQGQKHSSSSARRHRVYHSINSRLSHTYSQLGTPAHAGRLIHGRFVSSGALATIRRWGAALQEPAPAHDTETYLGSLASHSM